MFHENILATTDMAIPLARIAINKETQIIVIRRAHFFKLQKPKFFNHTNGVLSQCGIEISVIKE